MEKSQIRQFYAGQSVFLTGGTGFLGKALAEKLLRTCDLNRMYLLIRPKKGKTKEERFEDYFDSKCFDKLKSVRTDFRSKVRLISGDCLKIDLGLSDDDKKLLKDEVTCIIHSAATINFDRFIREAAYINVRAVRDLVKLASQMPKLVSFVHVSTAYFNCTHNYACERFYDPPLETQQLLTLLNHLDDETLKNITPHLLGKYPNTYVYTKNIGENCIHKEGSDLPLAVVRPAIVFNSMEEPYPGWCASIFGAIGVVLGIGLGVLRNMHGDLTAPFWIVPVDQCVNVILAAGWKVACRNNNVSDLEMPAIFNFVGCTNNYYTNADFVAALLKLKMDCASPKMIWYPTKNPFVRNYYLLKFYTFIQQIIPAYVVDLVLMCLGKPKIAMSSLSKLIKMTDLFGYFCVHHLHFQTKNLDRLWNELDESDKKLFNFDVTKIKSDRYIRDALRDARVNLLQDPLETVPQGQMKLRVLGVLHYTVQALWYYVLYRFFRFLLELICFKIL